MLDLPFSFARLVPYEDFERVVSEYDNELRKQTDLANAWKLIAMSLMGVDQEDKV